jgi:hypothetical protein
MIGGSATEIFFVNDGKTWSALLGEKAKESFLTVKINEHL